MINFYWYPKCSTCKKAKAWLENEHVDFNEVDIKTETPTAEEIQKWHEVSGLQSAVSLTQVVLNTANLD